VKVITDTGLIEPHGGTVVDRTGEQPGDLDRLETLTLTSREVSDLDMLACGALSPLEGFMGQEDYERVVDDMRLANGLAWALPVCLAVAAPPSGERVVLADAGGRPLGYIEVEEIFEYDRAREAERCFRTTDKDHPGVARLYGQEDLYLAGRVTVFDRPEPPFP
jgi:sulfate adenylyltransferase